MQTDQCEKRRARRTRCEVMVARSRSMRMIVGEDAVCWHSLSERLVLCLAVLQTFRLLEIDHSMVCSALKMKLTLKKGVTFNSKIGRHFSKVRGPPAYWAPQTKKSGGPAPPPRFRRLWALPPTGSSHSSRYPFRFLLSGSVSFVTASGGRGGRPFV